MAAIERKAKRYPSDLTDEEWKEAVRARYVMDVT